MCAACYDDSIDERMKVFHEYAYVCARGCECAHGVAQTLNCRSRQPLNLEAEANPNHTRPSVKSKGGLTLNFVLESRRPPLNTQRMSDKSEGGVDGMPVWQLHLPVVATI